MMPFLEAPTQEPFEKSHLLTDGAVPHVLFVTQEVHILVQAELPAITSSMPCASWWQM